MSLKTILSGHVDTDDQDNARAAHQQLRDICRGQFVQLDPGEVRQHQGRQVVYAGQVLAPVDNLVLDERGNIHDASPFGFVDDGPASGFTFYRRVESLSDAEHRKHARDLARREHELERTAQLRAQQQRPVTYADTVPEHLRVPTLSQAAHEIIRNGGSLDIFDGRLVVNVPQHLARQLGTAAKVCYLAEATVLEELAKPAKSPIDSRLPDKHVLPNGAIA